MFKIQVVIRLRPLNDSENHNGSTLAWQTRDKRIISSAQGNNQPYIFDRVYDCKDSTSDIFLETVEPIICAAMEGFNGTIFAYGQTSSGKTYTMSGTKNEKGIIPMAMKSMFTAIDNAPNRQFLMRVSYMEIYNEKITDLLDPEEKTLKLMEDENRFVHVSGLKENVLQNIDDMLTIKKKGDALRRVAETARNEESSRSHAIFRIIIESQERQDNDEDLRDESVRLSLLYFIDLAGSEKSSENTGDRFREGCAINKSLLILGQVIGKLSDGISNLHINYRDSKLTRLLQNGLGGNSKTAIICTVNPTAIEETHSTLRFASRAKTIKNQPMLNEFTDVSNKAILKRYQREIQQLKKQLESYKRQTPQKNLNPYYEYINNEKEKEQLEKKYQNTIDALKKMICVSTSENTKQKIIRRKTWCPGLLKRKIEPPILDTCGTPARFLDSIAETSVSDEEEKNDDTSNFQKRVSNSKRLMNQISCSVQTESVISLCRKAIESPSVINLCSEKMKPQNVWCYFCSVEIERHSINGNFLIMEHNLLAHLTTELHKTNTGQFFQKNLLKHYNKYIFTEKEFERHNEAVLVATKDLEKQFQTKIFEKMLDIHKTGLQKSAVASHFPETNNTASQSLKPHVTPKVNVLQQSKKTIAAFGQGLTCIKMKKNQHIPNVHSGGLPPWMQKYDKSKEHQVIGPSIVDYQKHLTDVKLSKLPKERVGANLSKEISVTPQWLPSFGCVWNNHRRLDTKQKLYTILLWDGATFSIGLVQ